MKELVAVLATRSLAALGQQRARPLWLRLGLALGLVFIGFLIRFAWGGLTKGDVLPAFVPAVMVAALLFGIVPGLLAAFFAGVLALWGFVEPVGSLEILRWTDAGFWVVFILSVVASVLAVEVLWMLAEEEETDAWPK